ncbi:hypothetical protein Q8W71_15950 [Methylobacterium sp. NEAU 140]|uniref:lipase family protein n=1 Tax=Methylobacterium sp. NEAU 140 TaxID=3064945 RepID=UPI0027373577|nr:hypothetical protein [Methylobacterium sp. NEAU 140]MDP4024123.1 hypothetical protein [Methylobacterium sp. NEAU 140]
MPITILDLAEASDTVYNFYKDRRATGREALSFLSQNLPTVPPGLSCVTHSEDKNSGFLAAAYRKAGAPETIIAIRGTVGYNKEGKGRDVGFKNFITDVGLYTIESMPSCLKLNTPIIADWIKQAGGSDKAILCGHSLGGAIATILAYTLKVPCCAFNAPTVSKMVNGGTFRGAKIDVSSADKLEIEKRIVNFNMRWDPISKASKAVGRVYNIDCNFSFKTHSQTEVIAALNSGYYYDKYGSKSFASAIR